MDATPEEARGEAGERRGVWKKAVHCNKTEGKETEGEQKGKTEKAKERKAPLRGCNKLPGKPLLRKLMPLTEKRV